MTKDPDNNSNNSQRPEDESEFGLTRPTGEMANVPDGERPASEERRLESDVSRQRTPEDLEKAAKSPTGQVWNGFETEEDYESEVRFDRDKNDENEEMDLTPMVDVTFLLLIFFMVTASFTLQKSIEQPPSKSEDPSPNYEEVEDEDEFIEIIIDQYNTYRLTSRTEIDIEAASANEMRKRLRDMVNNTNPKKLIIKHHGDATHEKVVAAWDAGVHNNILNIITQLTEVDF